MSEQPTCPRCDGKGWMSPSDADRAIEANGELFNADYAQGKAAAPSSAEGKAPNETPASRRIVQEMREYRLQTGHQVAQIRNWADALAALGADEVRADAEPQPAPATVTPDRQKCPDCGQYDTEGTGNYRDGDKQEREIYRCGCGYEFVPEAHSAHRDARLAAIVQEMRRRAQAERDSAHFRDDSYDDRGFEHSIRAKCYDEIADQLAALGADEEGK